ncbi:translesion error-prone DNA polymerase V autoproteolytic subunit [Paraperlucidibaca sp.]|jgi:DNA polymerase V|uniref:LexA family protein n=1 Tax=Paraperlucidibaca sp. TaxID=2708021 RepID=UPI0030F3D5CE
MNSIIGTPALSASHPRLPLLQGFVPAGFPSPAADYVQNTIDLHERLIHNPEATFFIRVSGDSMIDVGIVDGSVLIVDASRPPVSGDIVVASIDGQLTVKRFKRVADRYELHAENAQRPYPVLHPTEELQIFGVVTSHIVEHVTLTRPRR